VEPKEASMIFVFGSNLAGMHGGGAALFARQKHGAVMGQGVGLQGTSYAIPTMDETIRPLPLARIRAYVDEFLRYAAAHPELRFQVTPIGTGIAGHRHEDICPMFASAPSNCELPVEWRHFRPA